MADRSEKRLQVLPEFPLSLVLSHEETVIQRCQMVPRSRVTEKGATALITPVNISPSL